MKFLQHTDILHIYVQHTLRKLIICAEESTNNLSKKPLTNIKEHLHRKGLNYNTSNASELESSLKTAVEKLNRK